MPAPLDTFLLQSGDAAAMDDAAYYLITTAHEYTRAIPLARRAMQTASHSSVTYGYATFNYGLALLKTGQCKQALPLLRHALKIEAPAQAADDSEGDHEGEGVLAAWSIRWSAVALVGRSRGSLASPSRIASGRSPGRSGRGGSSTRCA